MIYVSHSNNIYKKFSCHVKMKKSSVCFSIMPFIPSINYHCDSLALISGFIAVICTHHIQVIISRNPVICSNCFYFSQVVVSKMQKVQGSESGRKIKRNISAVGSTERMYNCMSHCYIHHPEHI